MDFRLIAQAGLTQRDFAELCGVTRTTVSLWVTGKMNPHRYLRPQVERVMEALEKGVSDKTLPPAGHKRTAKDVVSKLMADRPEPVAA